MEIFIGLIGLFVGVVVGYIVLFVLKTFISKVFTVTFHIFIYI
jgi:ABC-type lipoprotein release transport system permease subunit